MRHFVKSSVDSHLSSPLHLSPTLFQPPLLRTDPKWPPFKLPSPNTYSDWTKRMSTALIILSSLPSTTTTTTISLQREDSSNRFHATFLAPKTQTSHDIHPPHKVYLLCFDSSPAQPSSSSSPSSPRLSFSPHIHPHCFYSPYRGSNHGFILTAIYASSRLSITRCLSPIASRGSCSWQHETWTEEQCPASVLPFPF